MRGGGVVFVVADHRRRFGAAADRADQTEQMSGIGLFDRKAVAAGDPIEQRRQPEPLEHGERRVLRLVGADRGAVAAPPQRRQGLRHPRIGPGQPHRIGLVKLQKARQRAPPPRPDRRRSPPARGQTSAGAPSPIMRLTCASDSGARPRSRSISLTAARRSGGAVDQRAVEIEDQEKAFHRGNFAGSRYAPQGPPAGLGRRARNQWPTHSPSASPSP